MVSVVGPTGPVCSEKIEAMSVELAAEFAMDMALDIFDGEVSAALAATTWRVRVTDIGGVVLAEFPVRKLR
jgi:transcriptional antiterminator Rof (Rho-off)